MSDYTVDIVAVSARPTAVSRGVATTWPEFASQWRPLLDGVWAFLRPSDLRTDGHNVMVYRGDVPNLEFEVGVEVSRPFDANGAVVPSQLPQGRAAHATHVGDYAGLGKAHDAVVEWCHLNGHSLSGTRWEVYGDWGPDPAKVQTDVYWQLND
jgi:effector-binding domain-containing protein